jgi:hypothetical protein
VRVRVVKAEPGEPEESAPQFAPMRAYPGMNERPRELAGMASVVAIHGRARGKP